MNNFSREYGFSHITSSPKFPQSNGMAENAVKTFKMLAKKNSDPYIALLTYRATPLQNGFSPAELCMGRRLRTTLPVAPHVLKPIREFPNLREKEELYKEKMKQYYDRRHNARELAPLKPGESVLIKDQNKPAIVQREAENAPRSYLAESAQNTYRRNRHDLIKLPTTQITRSGRVSKAPEKLNTPEIQPTEN